MKMEAIMPAKPTKTATIFKLLRRPKGASIAELRKAVGWKDHSIRAALTGLPRRATTSSATRAMPGSAATA